MILHLTLLVVTTFATDLPSYWDTAIDTATARRHMLVLSADSMRGRNSPSRELELSADYITQQFQAYGLEPVNGTYAHRYPLHRKRLLLPVQMTITHGGQDVALDVRDDFIPFDMSGSAALRRTPLVFAGFGITSTENNYDDYAGLDVNGAVVVVIRGEPAGPKDSTVKRRQYGRQGSVTEKARNARKHGAIGMLVIDAVRGNRQPTISGYAWPSLYPALSPDALPVVAPAGRDEEIPVVHVGERVIRMLFDSTAGLRSIIEHIDTTHVPGSFVISDHALSASWSMQADTVMLRNVVGMIRGEDEPDEYAIVGAHYDHVGVGRAVNNDSIFNGADDNASGTTAILQLAEAYAKTPQRPERSIVFIAFSAEERGLLGSRAYADTPLLPLDKCVAMVNLDMVGRCVNRKVSIGGQGRCPDLIAINEEENARLTSPYTLAYDIDSYFFRSDQANFARKRIPVLFYFTGEHGDYHKVTDEFAKINFDDMVGITRLVARTISRITEEERTRYVPSGWEDAR
jgi:hypothetical protein